MPSLTIIVPFYNEARTLTQLVQELQALPKEVYNQVVFVNDGSTDESEKILKEALERIRIPSTYVFKKNGGKASAVKEGLKKARTTHAVILDADLELKVIELTRLWEMVVSGDAEAVFGYRNFKSHSSYSYRYVVGNRVISHFYGIIFNQLLTDVMCGYKLFPVELKNQLPKHVSDYSIEIAIPSVLWKMKIKPFEVEVSYSPRNRDEGKKIHSFDAVKVLFAILKFRLVMRENNIQK